MIFKTVQIQKCVGYILPENIFVIKNGRKIKLSKGTKINQQIKNILISNGFKQISGFLLSENDFDENKASDLIARSICTCLLYTSPSPRDSCASRMPSSA